jgi:hypothetical protein
MQSPGSTEGIQVRTSRICTLLDRHRSDGPSHDLLCDGKDSPRCCVHRDSEGLRKWLHGPDGKRPIDGEGSSELGVRGDPPRP